jgi:hypothetical protein
MTCIAIGVHLAPRRRKHALSKRSLDCHERTCVRLCVGLARTIYTVYTRYSWQGNHLIYGHIQFIYTVLANLTYAPLWLCCTAVASMQLCLFLPEKKVCCFPLTWPCSGKPPAPCRSRNGVFKRPYDSDMWYPVGASTHPWLFLHDHVCCTL